VLGNDSDPNGDALSAQLMSGPSHGTLVLGADGSFSYTPAANFNGPDSFTYRASDGVLQSAPATVRIDVAAVNDPPLADAGADTTIVVGQSTTLSGAGSSDVDGDVLSYAWIIVSAPSGSTAALVDPSAVGPSFTPDLRGMYRLRLTVSDGLAPASDEVDLTVLGIITLTPDPLDLPTSATGFLTVTLDAPVVADHVITLTTTDLTLIQIAPSVTIPLGQSSAQIEISTFTIGGTVQVTASSGGFVPDTATVNVSIRVNSPPDARDDSASTQEDTPVAIDVLGNDADVDGNLDPLSLNIAGVPTHGTAVVDPATHRIAYTPQANYNGLDSFGYMRHSHGLRVDRCGERCAGGARRSVRHA
jgi:Big-like domain-containing protein/K319-like protein